MDQGLGEVEPRGSGSSIVPLDTEAVLGVIDLGISGTSQLEGACSQIDSAYSRLGYKLIRQAPIEVHRAEYLELEHSTLGVRAVILHNDDPFNLFAIAFRTPPTDNSGVPHALEHLILQGSQRFRMISPSTRYEEESLGVSNAVTCGDYTYYYARSSDNQDLRNFISILMDAVCHPLLRAESMAQDIVRLECDSDNKPRFNGALWNEINGAAANPEETVTIQALKHSFPGTPFAFDSGGDPQGIMGLSLEQLKSFFAEHYGPANAMLIFYGAGDHHAALEQATKSLQESGRNVVSHKFQFAEKSGAPKLIFDQYPCDPELLEDAQVHGVIQWNVDRVFPGPLLDLAYIALFDSHYSVLRETLLKHGLCDGISNIASDLNTPERLFGIQIVVSSRQGLIELESQMLRLLGELSKSGFSPEFTLHCIDALEVEYRQELLKGKKNEELCDIILDGLMHGYDPVSELSFDRTLLDLRSRVENGEDILADFIKQALVENTERVTFGISPSAELHQANSRYEREMAARRINEVIETSVDGMGLLWDSKGNSLSHTPLERLNPNQLGSRPKRWNMSPQRQSSVWLYNEPTDGLFYVNLSCDLCLAEELLPYAGVVADCLFSPQFWPEHGRFGDVLCGINAGNSFLDGRPRAMITIVGCALEKYGSQLLGAIEKQIATVNFHQSDRLHEVLVTLLSATRSDISEEPIEYAALRAESMHSRLKAIEEQCEGIEQLNFLSACLRKDANRGELAEKMHRTLKLIFQSPSIGLAGKSATIKHLSLQAEEFADRFPKRAEGFCPSCVVAPGNEAYKGSVFSSEVFYLAQSFDLAALGYRYHGSIEVLSEFLRHAYIWPRLRLANGVYAPEVKFDRHTGLLTFSSAYDISLERTLEVFGNTAAWLAEHASKVTELRRCKISALGMLNKPSTFDELWEEHFFGRLCDFSEADSGKVHEELMSTGQSDCRQLAELLNEAQSKATLVIIGSPQALKSAKKVIPGELRVRRI